MTSAVDLLLTGMILTNLTLVGSSRLATCIKALAGQGVLLALLPLLMPEPSLNWREVVLAILSLGLKGIGFPMLLSWAMRQADVRREVEPFVGYSASILAGVLTFGVSLWLAPRLGLPAPEATWLVLPTALFTVMIGLFLIVSRRTALNQVMGYLVLENGIYIFGLALAGEVPLLVEMGVLLDVFVGVFVMGITIFHISRAFDHIDVDQLSKLKD